MLLDWYRPASLVALRPGYSRSDLVQDLLAGALVGVVALPLSMGLAMASGVSAEQGLFTAIIGGVVVSLFGGSRVQIAGPAGAFVGLCAHGVKTFGYAGLALATMMAGVLMLLMGVMRLGRAMSFVPLPVIIGFTTGIAVVIASTQLAPALGLPDAVSEGTVDRFSAALRQLGHCSVLDLLVCIATMLGLILLRRLAPKLPAAILVLVAITTLCWSCGLPIATILSSHGGLPSFLPMPHLPELGLPHGLNVADLLHRFAQLSELALAIALLGSIESLLSATVADSMSGFRHEGNTELIGQGLANLLSPLFAGLPVTGVLARTSTNVRGGARSPVSGIVHSLCVLLTLVAFAPLVGHVPLACLSGILFMVCWHMAELRHWPDILRAHRGDAVLLPLTFLLTVFVDLTHAIIIGVLLGVLFFLTRLAESVRFNRMPGGEAEGGGPAHPGVLVFDVDGPFFFGAAEVIRDLDGELDQRPRAMVLNIEHVPFIDATAAKALRDLVVSCHRNKTVFALCCVRGSCPEDLARLGLGELIGTECMFPDLAQALVAMAAVPVRATSRITRPVDRTAST